MVTAVTTPGLSYGLDGTHTGPGPWLSVVREINARTDGQAFGTPEILTDGGRYVESYPLFDITMVGKFHEQRVTIVAYSGTATDLLIDAAASLGLTTYEI